MHRILLLLLALTLTSWANSSLLPLRQDPFSKDRLTQQSSLQLANPQGFQMQQSYSLQFSGSSLGTSSSGLYLNTLSYRFSIPLILSVDVGMYNLLHASFNDPQMASWQQSPQDSRPELVIPRIGLEYEASKNLSLSLQIINVPQAIKTYGSTDLGASSFWRRR